MTHDDDGFPAVDFALPELSIDGEVISAASQAGEVEALLAEREELLRQAENMRDAWNLERKRNHELSGEVIALRHEVNLHTHQARADGVASLKERIQSLEHQVELFQSEAGRMQRQVAMSEVETERMRKRLEYALRTAKSGESEAAHPMKAELEAELAMGRQMVETLSAACERYEQQIGQLRAENAGMRQRLDYFAKLTRDSGN